MLSGRIMKGRSVEREVVAGLVLVILRGMVRENWTEVTFEPQTWWK